jgi:hypothetical protein
VYEARPVTFATPSILCTCVLMTEFLRDLYHSSLYLPCVTAILAARCCCTRCTGRCCHDAFLYLVPRRVFASLRNAVADIKHAGRAETALIGTVVEKGPLDRVSVCRAVPGLDCRDLPCPALNARTEQDFTEKPLTFTVQAPHDTVSQPLLVP